MVLKHASRGGAFSTRSCRVAESGRPEAVATSQEGAA